MIGVIFDLDQTLIDTSLAEPYRPGNWSMAYQQIPHFAPYDGMFDVLRQIEAENIPYCIVTSSPSTYCVRVCNHWNIKSNMAVCYHDTPGKKKPHPAPILLGVSKLGLPASNILSFGDRNIDITASNAANVKSVACMWGAANREELLAANPTYTIEHPTEILSLIKTLRATIE